MQCKSCHAPIDDHTVQCPQCGIKNPQAISNSKKKVYLFGGIIAVILIVVIPMVALLLWMQSK